MTWFECNCFQMHLLLFKGRKANTANLIPEKTTSKIPQKFRRSGFKRSVVQAHSYRLVFFSGKGDDPSIFGASLVAARFPFDLVLFFHQLSRESLAGRWGSIDPLFLKLCIDNYFSGQDLYHAVPVLLANQTPNSKYKALFL